ncbi:GntR family transcriptional regulator [Peptostreptococcus anaerobius]|uniref:GntR family transcriptional regulator n=1 Tax=Peptostreptococcus anaerobius TaxID=1261 RepID=UPI00254CADBA|nr:GntR family transcriptional regulator [Peptostreptococcus anaerobius]MDK8278788.1 GntR family transcriptional regulator [Peptostreptococcus anaerobius]
MCINKHHIKIRRYNLKIIISNNSNTPLYQQIKNQIKDLILKEELVEGDMLPSIRSFSNDLQVSVLTIQNG